MRPADRPADAPAGGPVAAARRTGWLIWSSAPVHAAGWLAVMVAGAATPVSVAWLTKLVLDRLVTPGPPAELVGLAVALALAGLTAAAAPQLGQYLRAELDRRAALRTKDGLFAALERTAGLARFEDPAFSDRLRLAEQSAGNPAGLLDSAFQAGRGILMLVGFVGSLAVLNPWFTGVVLAAALPTLLVELRLSRQRAGMLWEISPAQRREFFYSRLLATVDAAKEIRLLQLGAFLRGRMNRELRTANAARRRLDRRELAQQGTLLVLAALISGAGLVWVVVAAGRGRLTPGDVTMFVAATAGAQSSLDGLVGGTARWHQQMLLFGHYLAVVDAPPDLAVPARPTPVPALRRGIELRDVWFRYSDEHPWVLRGVNLSLPHGRAVALVGRNGSGKSSLVKLLCRFYDPTRGQILWDGVDIRELPVAELRRRIGALFQDFVAYDFSAGDNIGIGDLAGLDDAGRIGLAARRAGVHDVVAALPRGYDTLLTRAFATPSERDTPQAGVVLSGGQWQRLALARAFMRADRDLMILDEPSAGLDAEAEHDVHARLREIRSNRTSLLISHRLGALRDADVIAVLSDGVIVERGTHPELLAAGGVYARLFQLQATGYQDAETPGAAPAVLVPLVGGA
jgi:ATP-binding cassette subfamily B protein